MCWVRGEVDINDSTAVRLLSQVVLSGRNVHMVWYVQSVHRLELLATSEQRDGHRYAERHRARVSVLRDAAGQDEHRELWTMRSGILQRLCLVVFGIVPTV